MNIYSKIKGILAEKLKADPTVVKPERDPLFLSKGQQGSEHHARLRQSGGRGNVEGGEWGRAATRRYQIKQRQLTPGQRLAQLRTFRRRTVGTHAQPK